MKLKYCLFTLRQISFERLIVFFFTIVLPIALITYLFNKNLQPTISALCESNARMIALRTSSSSVYKYLETTEYENLVDIKKDNDNKIIALVANTTKINKLTNLVLLDVQEKLDENSESKITIPFGSLMGVKLFGGHGIKINLKTIPVGDVEAKIKSEFKEAGINQTKHNIMIEIKVSMKILAPFYTEIKTFTNELLIAETVIVGDTPVTYYDIEGIENLNKKDTLNITN